MCTLGDEFFKALARLRDRIRARDPQRVESVRTRGFSKGLLEFCRVAQKSRSA